MSQVNIATRAGATYIGIESSYATLPTTYRVFPVGTPTLKPNQASLANEGEREHLFEHLTPVQGLKDGEGELKFYLRPDGAQLNAAATPTVTPPDAIALKAGLGGEHYDAGGTVAGSGSSSTAIVLGAGEGANFKAGAWGAVESGGALYPFRVTTIATETLTPWPSLGVTPTATTGVCINSYTYFPTQANTQSVYVQHAKSQDPTVHKWAFAGGRVALSFDLKRGELLAYGANIKFASWDRTPSDTIAVTSASDTARPPVAFRNATTWVQTGATLTRAHYSVRSIEVSTLGDGGLIHVPELGGTEGTNGVFRVGGRPFGTAKVRVTTDDDFWTKYEAQTAFAIVVVVPVAGATGIAKRFVVIDLPNVLQTAPPQEVDEGGQLCMDLTLELFQDATTTSSGLTGSDFDLATAPMRIALL
jgi:hypothetical protein